MYINFKKIKMKFTENNIGDSVENNYPKSKNYGEIGTIVSVDTDYEKIGVEYENGFVGGGKFINFNLVDGEYDNDDDVVETEYPKATKKMGNSLIKKLADLFRAEPEKTYRKLGIKDSEGNLTAEGKELFINKLFDKYEEEVVRPDAMKLLEAEESKKK